MLRFHLITIVVIIANIDFNSVQAKFPNDPKPCKYGDSDCILKLINYFVNEKSEGDSSVNLVKLDPLHVAEIRIKQGEESPVNIDLKFTDNDVYGLSSVNFFKVKGFGKDLTKKHELRFKTGSLSLRGAYSINGKVLILPISGTGKSNMTLVNTEVTMTFKGTPYEKDGEVYMKVTDLQLDTKPERLYYHFSNLFNGDKALGDNMNAFLNENWKDIYNEVRQSIQNAFARIFEAIITNVFTKYPYAKYFVEKNLI